MRQFVVMEQLLGGGETEGVVLGEEGEAAWEIGRWWLAQSGTAMAEIHRGCQIGKNRKRKRKLSQHQIGLSERMKNCFEFFCCRFDFESKL
jgi:hypothetical protein